MYHKRSLNVVVIILFSCLLFFLFRTQGLCEQAFPLDREGIFCLYFQMSGEPMGDQDIEDLCFTSERPIFTAYKPSEMFTKSSLKKLKIRLLRKMKEYSKDSTFKWSIRHAFINSHSGTQISKYLLNKTREFQPTPYIKPEISKNGLKAIQRAVNSLDAEAKKLLKGKDFKITVYLRPEKVDNQLEKRNIALVNVFLPIRRVIFHPVRIKILPLKNTDQIVLSQNISAEKALR